MYRKLIEKYKGKKIFRRMFAACFSLAAVLIVCSCVGGFLWFERTHLDEEKRNHENVLWASSLMIKSYMDTMEEYMETLRGDTYVKKTFLKESHSWDRDMSIAAQEIRNMADVSPMLHSIYLMSGGEEILKCVNPSYPMTQEDDGRMRELFAQNDFLDFFSSHYTDVYGEEQWILGFSNGELDPATGEKESGILISLDIGKIVEEVFSRTPGGRNYLLADAKGTVVAEQGGGYSGGEALKGELLELAEGSGERVSEILTLESGRVLVSGIRMENSFLLLELLPYSEISAPINHMRNMFIGIGCLLAVLMVLLAFAMSSMVYLPIDAAVRIAEDQEALPVRVKSRLADTELFSVAKTYQAMVQTLNNLNVREEQKALADYLSSRKRDAGLPEWVEENYGKEGVYSRVICLRISDTKDFQDNNTEEAIAFELQTITNLVEQALKGQGAILVNPVNEEYIAVLLFSERQAEEEALRAALEEIFSVTKELLHIGMDAGISAGKQGLSELKSMYQMARAATAYRFMYGVNSVISEEEMAKKALNGLKTVKTDALISCLKNSDREGFAEEYARLTDMLRQTSIQAAQDALTDMATELVRYQNSLNYRYDALTKAEYGRLERELSGYDYLDNAGEWFFRKADEIWLTLAQARKSGREDIVDRAVTYLKENYADTNISASYLADMFHITPSYFSRLFREKSGSAFPDYLATLRIERARELLLEKENKSIQEICEMVGYSNASYFTATFKKKYGITPGQYRKNHTAGEREQI